MEKLIGTQADYARHAGVSRQAVHKMVTKGQVEMDENGQINFAEADFARQQHADPARQNNDEEAAVTHAGSGADADPSYSQARATRERYQADLVRLEYEEKIGLLLRRQDVEDAMAMAGRKIRQSLDALPQWADDIDAAARNGGVAAVRALLRDRVRELESKLVNSLNLLVDDES